MRDIYDEVVTKFKHMVYRQNYSRVKDLDYIIHGVSNLQLKNVLEKLKDTFSDNDILDLHEGQWGESKNGKIILFDPVLSTRSFNGVDDLNDLDLKTEFSLLLEKVFDKSNSSYLKKIKKYLEKKVK